MENTVSKWRYNFDTFDLIYFIKLKFKLLMIIGFTAAVISAVVALMMEEKFKSTVILFPTTSASISKSLISNNVVTKDVLQFGEEEEVEQMLQVLQSDEIRNRIIEKYNLMQHYEIDSTSDMKMTSLSSIYNSNIRIKRTEYMSVRVDVLDKDPKMAADMANDIANLLDTVMNRMQKDRARKALKIVEDEYFYLENQIQSLEDSLTKIRRLGINDYESQAEVFNAAYAEALSKGASAANIAKLESKLTVLSEYGGAYVSLTNFLEFQKEALSDLKARYAEAKVDAEQMLPHKFIVNSAYPAERKSYPIRWLIVVVSTAVSGILAFLLLVVMEVFRTKEI